MKWKMTAAGLFRLLLRNSCSSRAGFPGSQPTGEGPGSTNPEGSIWVLLPDSATSSRWEMDDRRFFEEALTAAGVKYTIVNAEGDARTQQTQAEQAITAGAKVILFVNLDSGSGAAIIATAREAGIPIMDYDRLTVEGPGADVYVSFDNVKVGQTMAQVLVPLINNQQGVPQVVLLNGGETDNNASMLRQGYFDIVQPYFQSGAWELVDEQWTPNWDNQQALVIFEQMLTASDNSVSAVFAANDGLANAVISAFKNAGIDPGKSGIPISGQDATVVGIQHILSGDQAMTVYKPIRTEVFAAVEIALRMYHGQPFDDLTAGHTIFNGTTEVPYLSLEPIGVTAENLAETVIADQFRTWEEICVGTFASYCPDPP